MDTLIGGKVSASIILIFAVASLGAQTHNSVPVEEKELYRFLEMAEIADMINPLPTVRPLSRSLIKSALRQMRGAGKRLSPQQKSILFDYIQRFADDEDRPIFQDGDMRIKHEIFPMSWRFFPRIEGSADLADTKQSGMNAIMAGVFNGDLGPNISYGFEINAQLSKINIDDNAPYPFAWAPYTYTKVWDGGARYLDRPTPQYLMPQELSMAWALTPEIVLSFWENRTNFRFGRMRRDWGLGEGNLFLDKQARPFYGLEGTLSPWKWLSFSFLFGGLEHGPTFRNSPYVSGDYPRVTPDTGESLTYTLGAKEIAGIQQNMISLFLLEIKLGKWLYIGLYDAVVYPKRLEIGNLFPFAPGLLTQGNTGDFDNILFGGTIALNWPGLMRMYGTILIDEFKPSIPLSALRNQMAYQGGIKATLPTGLWSLLTLQYTKIEPFTYTHYVTGNLPWYGSTEMEVGYQNNGENIGSYLEPNSDELLLSFHVQPSPRWTARFAYRMIRHGGDNVNGSSYDSWGHEDSGGPDGDTGGAYSSTGTKNFLKDGTYEWFHIFSLGTSFDFRNLFAPVKISVQYSFVYEYDSDYGANNDFTAVEGSEQFRHLLTFSVNLWTK